MGNVVEWALKLSTGQFVAPGKGVVDTIKGIESAASGAVPDVAALGKGLDNAATAAAKAAGIYRDALGRIHDANGKFLKKSALDGVNFDALPLAQPKPSATPDIQLDTSVGIVAVASEAEKATHAVKSLSSEFDALQKASAFDANKVLSTKALSSQFDAIQATSKFDANKVLDEQSLSRGLARLRELRSAAAESAKSVSALESHLQRGIPTALQQAPRKLGAFARAVQFVGRNFGGGAAAGVIKLGAGLEKVQEFAAVAGPPLLAVSGAALAVGTAAAAGLGFFGKQVVEAQAFREDITRALTTLLKTREAADAALKTASQTADFIGRDRSQVAGQFVDLLAKGFDVKKVDQIVRSLADLSTVDPNADLERLTRTIGQIAGTGRLQGDELNELANAGLETGSVYDALAKRLGKTRQEIIKLKEAGKIDSDTAIAGILDAISAQAGGKPAGVAAAAKSVEDISGIVKRLTAIPGNVLFDLEVGPGLGTVKDALREVIHLFDATTATGQKVRAVAGEVFQAIVSGLFGEGATKGKTLEETFNTILETVRASTPQIEQFAANIRSIGEASALLVGLVGKFNELRSSVGDLGALGTILKVLFLPLVLATDGVFYLVDAFLWLAEAVGPALSAVGEAASSFGSNIILGLVNGIASNAQLVVDAISGVASDAIAAAKRILGIASPSKVFAEIGAFTMAGFEGGVAANDTSAQDAIASAIEPPDLSAISQGAQTVGAALASGGYSVTFAEGAIQVDAKGATAVDAQRIGEQVAEQVQATLENLARQLGAAA